MVPDPAAEAVSRNAHRERRGDGVARHVAMCRCGVAVSC